MERDLNIGAKLLPPHQNTSFAAMLESIAQQLAGNERGAKVDAYLMLAGSLKATGNIPEPGDLKDKMGLLLQFISRDMQAKNELGKPDAPLVINSLVLLASFLQFSPIGDSVHPDFAVSIVEHAIKTFEDPQTSKDIVKHLMFVLAQQKFSTKVMSGERVGRLLAALHNVESIVKGKSIVMGRLNIYRTLVRQSRFHMITNTLWLEDLFIDMLSSLKEIRRLAVLFGLEASFSLGGESKVSRAFSILFDEKRGEDINFAQYYADKLTANLANKQDTVCVAQIWSVIMLFLRGKPRQLENWPSTFLYMSVFQECLNSSDHPTRVEGNYAWNRFVFAVNPTETTAKKTIRLLAQPLIGQLKTRKSSHTRKSVMGSVCNLLYYTLRPSSTPAQLEFFWDTYVIPIVGESLNPADFIDNLQSAQRDLLDACTILQNLFDSSFQRAWVESRALASFQQNNVSPKELPALEPKWIRKNSSRIFPVLAPIMERLFWDLGEESQALSLWQTYVKAVSAPAVMEVTVHNDTMGSLASIFGMLHRIWRAGPGNTGTISPKENHLSADFLQCFEKLVLTTIEGLGIRPFVQRQLCVGTHDVFTPVATPSQRPNKLKGEIRTPLQHLFCLLGHISPDLEYDTKFYQMAHSLLLPFFTAADLNRSRSVELAKDLILLLPMESTPPSTFLWRVLANFVTTAVDLRDSQNNSGSHDQPIGSDYRNIVKILDAGISQSPSVPLSGWSTLFEALITSATLDAGVAGKAIVAIEPLAKCFMLPNLKPPRSSSVNGLSYFHLLLAKAEYPRDRHAVEAAKKRLWGVGNLGPRTSSHDPFLYFYDYIRHTLANTFADYNKRHLNGYLDMLQQTTVFVSSCPPDLLLAMLMKIQDGIVPWVQDLEKLLNAGNALSQQVMSPLEHRRGSFLTCSQITALWDSVCILFARLEETHGCNKILSDLEPLICSGLQSSHKSVVTRALSMWNTTFGLSEEAFEYPPRVQAALLRLRTITEIQLPFIPESVLNEEVIDERQPAIEFAETQEDLSSFLPTISMVSVLNKHRTPSNQASPSLQSSPGARRCRETTPAVVISFESSASRKRFRDNIPDFSTRKSQKRRSTPKLRHDDSQVQFQAVETSSPITDGTSTSQLLTDRQREVKARQNAEAAMFPDLRSSSHSRSVSGLSEVVQEAEPELPLCRSSSKARERSPVSAEVKRHLTPTPIPPSEDDNFMVSSPTPKRPSQVIDPSGPPSSPPIAPDVEHTAPDIEIALVEGSEPPSSPPQAAAIRDQDSMPYVEYPSAQVDPLIIVANSTISPSKASASNNIYQRQEQEDVEGTVQSSNYGTAPDPPPSFTEIGISETNHGAQKKTSTPLKKKLTLPPSTPPRTRASRTRQLVESPPFVDAKSSPPSSDRDTVEDVFEDAISSPRLTIDKRGTQRTSTTPIDVEGPSMDDSSILRMMEDFDEPTEQSVAINTLPNMVLNPRRSLRSSLRGQDTPSNSPSTTSIRKAALKNATASKMTEPCPEATQPPFINPHDRPTSSVASVVPETPTANTKSGSPEKALVLGNDPEAGDIIVVDTSDLEQPYRAVGFRKRTCEDAGLDLGSGVSKQIEEDKGKDSIRHKYQSLKI